MLRLLSQRGGRDKGSKGRFEREMPASTLESGPSDVQREGQSAGGKLVLPYVFGLSILPSHQFSLEKKRFVGHNEDNSSTIRP
jgi:hypothetical protein